ncbi:SH3 domain-containing protein [Sagittula sp. SSi028]|uniref:SH3 domain-containing protein n=1 Tax=Sagittula sp. SSi028 TaxID=3400636 RepID=UPI003AF867B6
MNIANAVLSAAIVALCAATSARSELMEVYNITSGDSLNVRLGPGATHADIGDLQNAAIVNVLSVDESGKWAQIRYRGQLAWVSHSYLRVVPVVSSALGPHFVSGIPANDPDGGLVVRSGDGTSHPQIGVLPQGTAVHVIERRQGGDWAMIRFGTGIGFVSTAYLGSAPPEAPSQSDGSQVSPGYYTVSGVAQNDRLNVRAAPNAGSDIVSSLAPGASVFVNGPATGNWVSVSVNGQSAYVNARFLTRQSSQSGSQTANGFPLGVTCRGTEPFWTLSIADDRSVTYTELNSGADPMVSLVQTTPASGGGYPFAFVAGPYTGSLDQQSCSDGMSDTSYSMTISFDRLLSGGVPGTHYGCCNLN